jgi:hypothetical protein
MMRMPWYPYYQGGAVPAGPGMVPVAVAPPSAASPAPVGQPPAIPSQGAVGGPAVPAVAEATVEALSQHLGQAKVFSDKATAPRSSQGQTTAPQGGRDLASATSGGKSA